MATAAAGAGELQVPAAPAAALGQPLSLPGSAWRGRWAEGAAGGAGGRGASCGPRGRGGPGRGEGRRVSVPASGPGGRGPRPGRARARGAARGDLCPPPPPPRPRAARPAGGSGVAGVRGGGPPRPAGLARPFRRGVPGGGPSRAGRLKSGGMGGHPQMWGREFRTPPPLEAIQTLSVPGTLEDP